MTLVFKKHKWTNTSRWHCNPKPNRLWKLNTGLQATSPLFLQTLGPWFPNEIQNLLSSEKRTLDHWGTVQFFFSLAQVRRLWRQLWPNSLARLCVMALDDLTPASVYSLWSSPKFLNRFCLTILIRPRFSRLVVHLFLPNFFLPLNFLLTCLDTALCEQPASLAMNVCGLPSLWRVPMIVFWTTVRSAVFPMIV